MKKGYWVVAYRAISDESALKAYAALALPCSVVRRALFDKLHLTFDSASSIPSRRLQYVEVHSAE